MNRLRTRLRNGTATPTVATPTFSPDTGSYGSAQDVTISCATSGATIYYTTNGDTPTTGSTEYSAPVNIASTSTLKAIAVKTGYNNSAVGSATYTITSVNVANVFSTDLYNGTGSAQTITTGIDTSTGGGSIMFRGRQAGFDSVLFDTARGTLAQLVLSGTSAQGTPANSLTAFGTTGFTVGADGSYGAVNQATNEVAWSWKKNANFHWFVTFTAGSDTNRRLSHGLGVVPGKVVVRRYTGSSAWYVYHKDLGRSAYLVHNTTAASVSRTDVWGTSDPTTTDFGVDETFLVNGGVYIAYFYAHEPAGVIQSGSFTTDGSGNASVDHGWASGVQYVELKATTTTGDWEQYDTERTSGWTGNEERILMNATTAPNSVGRISTSGTTLSFAGLSASQTYVYEFVKAP